jgi:hypothetical protein
LSIANEEDHVSRDLDVSADSPIDNVKSCAAMYRCYLPHTAPARFCDIHMQTANLLLSTSYGKGTFPLRELLHHPKPLTDNDWKLPADLTGSNSWNSLQVLPRTTIVSSSTQSLLP